MKLDLHLQACLEAWLTCENLLMDIAQRSASFSSRTRQVVDECAQICLGTMHGLRNRVTNRHQLALLCVGLCEECAEVCERYPEDVFKECATACRKCSAAITHIAEAAV